MQYNFDLYDANTHEYLGRFEIQAHSCKSGFKKVFGFVTKAFPGVLTRVEFLPRRPLKGSGSEFDSFVRQHRDECYDEDGEFDWDAYQNLCDIADYWDMEG